MLFAIDCKGNDHITVLAAINYLYAAWDAVKESTIAERFKHAGFTCWIQRFFCTFCKIFKCIDN